MHRELKAVYWMFLTKREVRHALKDPESEMGKKGLGRVREAILRSHIRHDGQQDYLVLKHVGKIYFFHSMNVFDSEYLLLRCQGKLSWFVSHLTFWMGLSDL